MRQGSINGKGAVFQVSDTKWVAKVCLGVDDRGKPIIKQFSGKTEAIAYQASARGGKLYCENKGDRIQVSGKAVLYSVSEIYVP